MIAAWILYATVLGALVAGAAVLAEQFAHTNGWATRRVWALGLAAAIGLPGVAVLVKDAPPAVEFNGEVVSSSPTASVIRSGVDVLAVLDDTLVTLWGIATVGLALLLLVGLVANWRRHRSWDGAVVDGVPVLLAENTGPAVIGFLRSRIVLPRWALDAEEAERKMMLRHEQEHLSAGDPRLILFSALLVVAMPWNLALWFMAHRLRLAIEVDCDKRVMKRQDVDTRSYAELLLSVGQRRSVGAYGVGFSLGRPFLEERIDRMTAPEGGARRSTNALMVLGVFGVLCAAWSLPQPVKAANVSHDWELTCPGKTTATNQALLGTVDWDT